MAVKTTHEDYTGHVTHILNHSKLEGPLRTMARSDFFKGSESLDGLPANVLETVNASQEKWIGAGVHVTTDDCVTQIKAARDAGDSTDALKSMLRISTLGGSTEIVVRATRTRQNPRTGEPVTKHGVVDVSIDADRRIPGDAAARAQSAVTAALGLTEDADVKKAAD